MAESRKDTIWQMPELAASYLQVRRRAIPTADLQIEVMLRLLNALDHPVRRFLDLGCGDGILAAAIRAQYPQACGVLVDFSEPMLTAARTRFTGNDQDLHFYLGDFADARWVDALAPFTPLDAVVSGLAIHHQPDARKRALYAEIFSLLTPGGLFLNIEHVAGESPWVATVWDDLYIDYLTRAQTGDGVSREEVAARYAVRPDKAANILAPLDTQCAWLREIGYTDVACYAKIFELAVFGGRRGDPRSAG